MTQSVVTDSAAFSGLLPQWSVPVSINTEECSNSQWQNYNKMKDL